MLWLALEDIAVVAIKECVMSEVDAEARARFRSRVKEAERKKLRAIQEKLPKAIADRNAARVAGLALSAERVAARLMCLLDQKV